MRPTLFAFFTGLHLALLQFSYFFLLLINITSTYITYAAVVLSWMLGTLIGLLWRRLRATPTWVVGVISYYLIYALVMSDPLSPYTFAAAVVGVAVTGLWAGRFFVALLPYFPRADQLFFHENNGFLLGIIGVFVGFTLFGQFFLMWTPLLSGLALAVYLTWLLGRPAARGPQLAVGPAGGSESYASAITASAIGQARRVVIAMAVINVLLPTSLFVHAGLTGEDYWDFFDGERNAITWFSTLQLLVVGLVAYANYALIGLLKRAGAGAPTDRRWIWLVFALGFVFLGIDERFEVHEALRDNVLIPADLFVGLAWARPGDIVLHLYLGIGLILTGFLISELRRAPRALTLFLAAIGLSGIVVVIDALPLDLVSQWPGSPFWDSAFEEMGELWAQFLFLCSFMAAFVARLKRLLGVTEAVGFQRHEASTLPAQHSALPGEATPP